MTFNDNSHAQNHLDGRDLEDLSPATQPAPPASLKHVPQQDTDAQTTNSEADRVLLRSAAPAAAATA